MLLNLLVGEACSVFVFDVVASVRATTAPHSVSRERCEEKPGKRRNDLSFMAGWPSSARLFLDFVSKTVFAHAAPFANGVQHVAKAVGSAQAALCHGPFQEAWGQITAYVAREAKEACPDSGGRPSL